MNKEIKTSTGSIYVTGANATIIGSQTIGLSTEFVRDLLAAKDRQIEELLKIIARLKN